MTRRLSDNQKGCRTAGGRQGSEEGAKEPVVHRADKRAPSSQKMYLLPTFMSEPSDQDGVSSQEGIDSPGGEVSSEYESL